MIIDCLSDLHGTFPKLAGGDLLILAGDYTSSDKINQWEKFFSWLKKQPYGRKVIIAGNHDNFLSSGFPKNQKKSNDLDEVKALLEEQKQIENSDFDYLCDSMVEIEGLKIWGTPWSLLFEGINPHCKAFTGWERDLQKKYDEIPEGIDILISHSPFMYILDENLEGEFCGSFSLRKSIERINPKLFVCGHIHEQGGKRLVYKYLYNDIKCINASLMDAHYNPVHQPVRVIL